MSTDAPTTSGTGAQPLELVDVVVSTESGFGYPGKPKNVRRTAKLLGHEPASRRVYHRNDGSIVVEARPEEAAVIATGDLICSPHAKRAGGDLHPFRVVGREEPEDGECVLLRLEFLPRTPPVTSWWDRDGLHRRGRPTHEAVGAGQPGDRRPLSQNACERAEALARAYGVR